MAATFEHQPQTTRPPAGRSLAPHAVAIALFDHYEAIAEIKGYYGVLAIYALARAATSEHDHSTLDRMERAVRRFPDEIDHPPYNFPSYRIGGIAQAFLSAEGRLGDRAELLRKYAEEMMQAPRDSKGILTMPGTAGNPIWIDVAMAASPFLLYAGKALNDARYVDEAISQSVLMYDEFRDDGNGLLHQCKNFVAPGELSQDHWSRGNGWGIFALAELVRGLPADARRRDEVEQRFVALASALLPYQTGRGLWRQEVPMDAAWEESSGTGLILYSIGVGVEQGLLVGRRWENALSRGIQGLAEWCVNPDFSTENSCQGTLCPGSGEDRGTAQAYVDLRAPYRDEPHSFAPFILAMSVAPVARIDTVRLRGDHQPTARLGGL